MNVVQDGKSIGKVPAMTAAAVEKQPWDPSVQALAPISKWTHARPAIVVWNARRCTEVIEYPGFAL